MKLVTFGDSTNNYDFPEEQSIYRTNFSGARQASSRIPFMSGAFDDMLGAANPSDLGQLHIEFTLVTHSRSDMEPLRDAVRAMRGWGTQRLIAQPTNPLTDARYTWA